VKNLFCASHLFLIFLMVASPLHAVEPLTIAAAVDTPLYVNPFVYTVTAPRMEIPLRQSPAATTVVTDEQLQAMPRTIAVDEAVKLVPGVRVENQADGSRVHMSIRGQGILTERGIRGIKILLDGLPLNDPTGFAPDLYDVDWATVQRLEVLRGPAAALYGGGSSGGVVNITTQDGPEKPLGGEIYSNAGSYNFEKALGQIGGTSGDVNYRVSASRMQSDGYRVHTAYHGNNIYAKLRWDPTPSVRITPIFAWTEYFNENAEGLNALQVQQDRRMANPDAVPFNEYQLTRRFTNGLSGVIKLPRQQDIQFNGFFRMSLFEEAVPSSVQHRTFLTPGASVQYNRHCDFGWVKNHVSLGSDVQGQNIAENRFKNLGRARQDTLLSNQSINQNTIGAFLLDRVELGSQWSVNAGLRYDHIRNSLLDDKADAQDLSGKANFEKTTARFGAAFTPRREWNLYANWGQGFLPPATEELANNPAQQGGFNAGLAAATSQGEELGVRGEIGQSVYYDVTGFHLQTDKDFDRYRISSRPLETFYRNLGSSRRYGVETLLGWSPVKSVLVQAAYTYSDFTYTKPDTFKGNRLPNSPVHMTYVDVEWRPVADLRIGASSEMQSKWTIDSQNSVFVNGYTLYHLRAAYGWSIAGMNLEIAASVRNILNTPYIAFTEPDPDGNSYQPAPRAEYFGSLRLAL
jgi:iron complex outermembrane receptor protein